MMAAAQEINRGPQGLETSLRELGILRFKDLHHQPPRDYLIDSALAPTAEIPAELTPSGAISVETAPYTGRAPKAKAFVERPGLTDDVWRSNPENPGLGNHMISPEAFEHLLEISLQHLNDSDKSLYVVDSAAIADESSQLGVRLITQIPHHALFAQNMFRQLSPEQERSFQPDWTIVGVPTLTDEDYAKWGLRDKAFVVIDSQTKTILIGGTKYAGEIKKSIFSVGYKELVPQGIAVMHCSAVVDQQARPHVIFGLSGTGKTTLSNVDGRTLIGDDEHIWNESGVFNFEGGCYAKAIDITEDSEPEIWTAAMSGSGVIYENVFLDDDNQPDFHKPLTVDGKDVENSRISYSMEALSNVELSGSAGHPETAAFLTMDSFGVLPPIALLTPEQAMYYYISGYTSKTAGTEKGVVEPQPTFSPCFAGPFIAQHPIENAQVLREKLTRHNTQVALVNTGAIGGGLNEAEGQRVPLKVTRRMMEAFQNGEIEWDDQPTQLGPFSLVLPKLIPGVDPKYYNPQALWGKRSAEYEQVANDLGEKFNNNFAKYTDHPMGKELAAHGLQLP